MAAGLMVHWEFPFLLRGLADPAFSDVVHSISTQDQDFCLKALSDLNLIILHLQQIPIPEGLRPKDADTP